VHAVATHVDDPIEGDLGMLRYLPGLLVLWHVAVGGQIPSEQASCPDGQTIDGLRRAGDAKACLVLHPYTPARAGEAAVLVVYLHGDGGGRISVAPGQGAAQRLADATGSTTLLLQRPGYRSDLGTSDGFTSAQDDDYTGGNTELIARALDALRASHPGRKLLLVGHSGGAAMSALVASRYPGAADAYLLAGCPCDVPTWRQWRNVSAGRKGTWGRSLSPLDEVAKVPRETLIRLVVGDSDDNTLSKFSQTYVEALNRNGNPASVEIAPGATHDTILRSRAFLDAARRMVLALR
jgi:pimeloyl-ACP methyl ester carboxylesterase